MSTIQLIVDGVTVYSTPGVVVPPVVVPPTPGPATPPPPPPPAAGTVSGGDLGPEGTLTHVNFLSEQVVYFPLPTAPTVGHKSITVKVGETTGTAPGSFIEICASRTPGAIDPTAGANYQGSYIQNDNEMVCFLDLGQFTPAQLAARSYASTPKDQGPWYLNVKVKYPTPGPGGFDERVITWGDGPY